MQKRLASAGQDWPLAEGFVLIFPTTAMKAAELPWFFSPLARHCLPRHEKVAPTTSALD
ncbi:MULTISPECIES: hypothetical protein [Pseudomonas]|uniref:Uncharacterized protein n=1 Tax=Pseudomonas gingeri TaxID=117681 RepID=A0A7Y7WLL7_9PSED|nr:MULTISPECIES: hypothetical protein [Pseudomonas]NWB83769.1 hypothetical protein [Pseudomonas gingeri]